MKLKIKNKRYSPSIGDILEEKKFAFLPTRIDSNVVVWLEFYNVSYEYEKILSAYEKFIIENTNMSYKDYIDYIEPKKGKWKLRKKELIKNEEV